MQAEAKLLVGGDGAVRAEGKGEGGRGEGGRGEVRCQGK